MNMSNNPFPYGQMWRVNGYVKIDVNEQIGKISLIAKDKLRKGWTSNNQLNMTPPNASVAKVDYFYITILFMWTYMIGQVDLNDSQSVDI